MLCESTYNININDNNNIILRSGIHVNVEAKKLGFRFFPSSAAT